MSQIITFALFCLLVLISFGIILNISYLVFHFNDEVAEIGPDREDHVRLLCPVAVWMFLPFGYMITQSIIKNQHREIEQEKMYKILKGE